MKTSIKTVAACLCTALLASCGGSSENAQQAPVIATTIVTKSSAQQAAPADYHPAVQRIYVAYFGRPADPAGLAFYANNYQIAGAPTDIGGISSSYGSNATVKSLIDAFATSQESQDLYPGDNSVFLDAVYRNLFNREPDAAGKAYWVDLMDRGLITRAVAAVAVMGGAQTTDLDLINMKSKVAGDFTTSLNTPTRLAAYDGLAANAVVRSMLAGVTLSTDVNNFQATIENTINTLVANSGAAVYANVAAIIQSRCVGCHSASPTIPGFSPAPAGIRLDTSAEIHLHAARIHNAVVQTRFMPYGNITNMTDAERGVIDTWFKMGAP